jgi:hypothetical protein
VAVSRIRIRIQGRQGWQDGTATLYHKQGQVWLEFPASPGRPGNTKIALSQQDLLGILAELLRIRKAGVNPCLSFRTTKTGGVRWLITEVKKE